MMFLSASTRSLTTSQFWKKQYLKFSSKVHVGQTCFNINNSATNNIALRSISSAPIDFNKNENIVDASKADQNKQTLVSTMKDYILMRRDYTKKYTANNTITAIRAMQHYMLSPSDLESLKQIRVRSPYVGSSTPLLVYLEKDVEQLAKKVWGSMEGIEKERKRTKKLQRKQQKQINLYGETFSSRDNDTQKPTQGILQHGSAKVVAYAAAANATICVFKLVCFLTTRSASMFSEMLHSLADTCNQLLLLWGVNESLKKPDVEHPYGFGNMRHIMSLISGVGIFCIGCGVSVYHGMQVLLHPTVGLDVASNLSFAVLLGASLIESGSLMVAINETKKNAKSHELSFWDYVKESRDPSTNVVLLEDSAAVLGVGIAGTALALAHYTGNPVFDAIGSIAVGGLLGAVATFLVTTNVNALIGRSIPQSRLEELQELLEDDAVIRGVYDVKATQLNADEFKFKAEIDFDGREITRAYLATVDMAQVLREIHGVQTLEELEEVILRYGEHVIDTLGVQVDRIENELKKHDPDLRHIDLEVL